MVSNINDVFNLDQSTFQPQISQRKESVPNFFGPLNSFSEEDEAIISSEAKLQYELEKFNSGGDNFVELMGASVMAKTTVETEVSVINTKKDMMDEILKIGED